MLANNNHGRVLLKIVLGLVVLAGVAAAVYFGLQSPARVAIVKRGLAEDAVTGSVVIDAEGGIRELKSEANGKVINVDGIAQGAKFKEGDPLVLLDTSDLVRARDEAQRKYDADQERAKLTNKDEEELELAKEALETARRLHGIGELSDEQLRNAERALKNVQTAIDVREFDRKKAADDFDAMVKDMNRQIERMTIRAPSDGAVHQALVSKGALIHAGQPVALIFSNERVVAAKISEESFGRVKIGQPARLRLLTYENETYDATVKKLHPVADDAQRFTVFLDVKVDPERLKPKSTGEVTITVDRRENQLMIPRRALFNGDQVLVVKNGRVELRTVEVGFRALNAAEIRGGLEEGDYVIVENLEQFRPGKRVRVEIVE